MRKIFLVLVSVLLLAGVAQAAEWTQSLNADLTAQNIGRSRTTDTSVIIQIWNTAGANPGVGVSATNSLMLYNNIGTQVGFTLDTGSTALDTVGEVVDYINTNFSTDTSVKFYAAVGPDGYRGLSSSQLDTADIAGAGITRATAAGVEDASSRRLSVGVQDSEGVTPRVKSIQSSLPLAATSDVTLTVYDGNTAVWRKYISNNAYNSATADAASANSVVFPGKGISATKGNGICIVATTSENVRAGTDDLTTNSISIVYDNLKD